MKNFTNNFKQFTSRLCARWLIMALMMLVGTSSVWAANYTIYFEKPSGWGADIYFCIGKSNWTDFDNKMTHICGNYYKITISWDGAEKIGFTDCNLSSWSDNNESIDGRYAWVCNNKTPLTKSIATNRMYYMSGESITYKTQSSDPTCVTTYTVKKSESGATGGTVKLGDTVLTTSNQSINSGSYALSITAPTGYKVTAVSVSAGTLTQGTTGSSTYNGTLNVTAATTVSVTYAKLTYSISYNANGGSGAPAAETKIYGETLTLSSTQPTRTGYTFQNWNTASNGSGTAYASGASYTANAAATLYAQWTANQYNIIYKDQGGANFSGTHASGYPTTHTYGTATALKTASKTGYTFGGWFTNSACTGNAVTSLGATAYTSNITLYAKWTANQYTITYKDQGNVAFSGTHASGYPTTHTYGTATELKTATKAGYTFGGWFTTSACTGNAVTSLGATAYSANITLYAQWKEVCVDPSNIVFTINSPQSTYYLGDKVAATLSYDGTEVEEGHSWTYDNTAIGILGPAPKKGASFTFTLKKATNSTDVKINLPKCSSGTVASKALNFAITALPAPTNATASVTGNTANLLWTPGVRDSVLIVRYAKDATATAPTANTKYIVGNEIGNGMVVYKGTGTSFSNSGLTYGNAYDYYFYTVNNNYYSTANNPKATVSVCPTAITGADNIFVNKTSEYTVNATTGALYAWRLDTDTEATLTSNGNTATVTAGATAGNATISVTISGGNCDGITLTKDITIKDGIVIYIRRPKSGDGTSVYSNWYNESSVKGGLPWVKQGPISGSNNNNQATTNNTGGTELTEAFTDCDGYTWDSFTPADSWSSFYLHALNDYKQDGWATFTKAISFDKSTDNYFYLSSWNNGDYGVTITKTDAPALGITIAELGSKEVISNNMASFAALYLKGNCSGKELKTDSEGDFTDQTFLWQYSTDGTSWSTYTGGDGATWNNIRPTQAGKYKLICTMEDDSPIESNIIEIATTTESYDADDLINIESSLPIFMVNTGGKGFPSCVNASDFPTKHADALKKKRSVDVKIKVGNDIVYDRKARMNYRGSSSLNFKKKSYAFSSGQEYCGLDKDESPDYMKKGKMDMFSVITKGAKTSSEEKDWVLYAANPDPSMMRNILAIDTYKAMTGEWGVQNQYVELYVDGVYQGVYVFLDKITQGKERINVKWDVDDASKRGFILKFDKTDVADRYEDATGDQKTFESDLTGASGIGTYGTQVDQRFEIEYPEKGDIEDDGGSWAEVKGFIEAKVNAFESALKDGKFNEVRNMIDYQSWADFFIINEFVKNVDAYRASCIFVYEDNKLKAYPLWDYELSFNNQAIGSGKGKADPTGLLIEHDDVYSDAFAAPFWWTGRYSNHTYKGLLDDPCFVSMIKTRWDMHANGEGALTQSKLQDLVDSYTTALTKIDATDTYNSPKEREAKKWPYTYNSRGKADCNSGNTGYYAGWTSDKCEADMTALTTWIGSGNTGRRDNLDGIIEEMASDISFSLSVVSDKSTTTPWRPVIITVSSNSGYEYTITPEAAQVKDNGNQHTIYLARPEGTEGTNFATQTDAYTFTATSGETDQCGSSEPVSQSVKITLEDIEENCP